MTLQLAIFASFMGMALSMTTPSATPGHHEAATTTTTTHAVSTSLHTTSLASSKALTTLTRKASTKTSAASAVSSTISSTAPSTAAPIISSASSRASASPAPPANTITIAVGESGLAFTPNSIEAVVGDILEFSFYPRNHSVALGTWDHACEPAAAASGGFFSGFIPVDEDASHLATFQVPVDTPDPMVFYCSAGRHCQEGMFGVVNPANSTNATDPHAGDTIATYAVMARNASTNVSPPAVFGGSLAFNGTAINTTTNGTVCGRNSANITSATTWCIPYIPDISSDAASLAQSLWAVMVVVVAVCLL
ncbi:hypothetical protein SCUCBS95973_004897 [Sporothrix curviconia]|uniref:Extracellular serine-rich protein n=1 Tax=Sporothrix curviconia TaxID=1260050 RepID=A0ABP0BSX4_9PEZI